MPLENPSDKSVQTRDEMICPVCFNYSIREHASSDEYNSEKMKMYKASYCANPKCGKNLLSPDEVKQQYEDPGFISNLTSLSFTSTQMIQAGIVIIGILLLLSLAFGLSLPVPGFGGDSTPEGTFEVSGVLETDEDIDEISVTSERTGNSGSISYDGSFSVVVAESDEIVIRGEDGYAIDRVPVEVEDDTFTVTSDSTRYRVSGDELAVSRVTLQEYEYNQIVQDSEVEYPLTSADNAETIEVQITPISEASSVQTINILEESAITIPDGVLSQETTVTVEPQRVPFESIEVYDGGPQRFDISNASSISDVQLTVDRTAGENVESEEWESNGDDHTVQILEDSTNVLLELESLNRTTVETTSGESSNGQIQYTVPDIQEGTAVVTVDSPISKSNSSTSGQISDSEISPTYSGSLSPENIKIEFIDGDLVDELVGSDRVSANAESISETSTVTLTESASEGTYRLEYESGILESPELTTVGYRINGGEIQEVSDSGSVEIQVSEGDSIELIVIAEKHGFEPGSQPMGALELDELEFQRTVVSPGSSTGVRAYINNPNSTDEPFTAVLYKDGEEIQRSSTTIPARTDRYELLFDRVFFEQEGVYGVGLNDTQPTAIRVGDADIEYGSGYIEAELYQVEERGEVAVDTNSDGEYDCVVSAIGGACNLSTTGEISVEEQNVSNTEYEISYTSQSGVSGMTVDSGRDADYSSGVLDGSQTFEVDVEGGDTITVASGNAEDFNYDIEIIEPEEVRNPVVRIDGEIVAEPDSFTGSTTVNLGPVPSNAYSIRIESESNSSIGARLSWVEGTESVYPSVLINDTEVCEGTEFSDDLTCSIDATALQEGMNTIEFSETQSAFEYRLSYSQSESADTVRILEDGEVVRVIEREEGVIGSWSKTVPDVFSVGSHTVSVDADGDMDSITAVTVIQFEDVPAENPRVVVTSGAGEESVFEVPSSALRAGVLETRAVVEIPPEAVSSGENTLYFTSDNSGVYMVEFTVTSDISR